MPGFPLFRGSSTIAERPVNEPFGVGKVAVHTLAERMCLAGMEWGDAVEEAYDFFLRRAGGHITRIGEVFLPDLSDRSQPYATAVCARSDR